MGTSGTLSISDWCLNTGENKHMCWNKELLNELSLVNTKRKVKVGNGQLLDVKGIGNVTIWASDGCELIFLMCCILYNYLTKITK